MILHSADPSFDFGSFSDKLEVLLNFCMLDCEICVQSDFSMFAIAVSCILITLDHLQWHDFASELESFVSNWEGGLSSLMFELDSFSEITQDLWMHIIE